MCLQYSVLGVQPNRKLFVPMGDDTYALCDEQNEEHKLAKRLIN